MTPSTTNYIPPNFNSDDDDDDDSYDNNNNDNIGRMNHTATATAAISRHRPLQQQQNRKMSLISASSAADEASDATDDDEDDQYNATNNTTIPNNNNNNNTTDPGSTNTNTASEYQKLARLTVDDLLLYQPSTWLESQVREKLLQRRVYGSSVTVGDASGSNNNFSNRNSSASKQKNAAAGQNQQQQQQNPSAAANTNTNTTSQHQQHSSPQHHNKLTTKQQQHTLLEDPLGLVSDNTEGLEQFHLQGDTFNPKSFLATVHQNVPYEQLISDHSLTEKDEYRQRQMQNLVADNLDRFVKAKDTVVNLHDENTLRIERADSLIRCYHNLQRDSKHLFGKMIRRKRRTEKIKEVLSIFKRHQYVFDIPTSIMVNMERRDYNQVVYDYKKAKSFRQLYRDRTGGERQVPLFVPIFEKIDSQIELLRQMLFRELQLNQHTLHRRHQEVLSRDVGFSQTGAAGGGGITLHTGTESNHVRSSSTSSAHSAASVTRSPHTSIHYSHHSHHRQQHKHHGSGASSAGSIPWVPLLDEERERIITYLLALDASQDPAWYYLDQMYSFIVQTIESTSKKYLDRVRDIQIAFLIKEKQQERTARRIGRTKSLSRSKKGKISAKEMRSIQKLNVAIERECHKLIQTLGEILSYYMDHFWALSQNILSNKYKSNDDGLSLTGGDDNGSGGSSGSKNTSRKPTTHTSTMDRDEKQELERQQREKRREERESKIKSMFNHIIECYVDNCTSVLEEVDNGQAHQPTLCNCVQSIVKCHYTLEEQLGIQKSFLSTLKKYTFTQHKRIVNETWQRTIEEVFSLHNAENWQPISETVQITHLPILFFNHMKRTLSLLKPFMELKSKNNAKSPFFGMMVNHFCSALEAFAEALHELAFKSRTHARMHFDPSSSGSPHYQQQQQQEEYDDGDDTSSTSSSTSSDDFGASSSTSSQVPGSVTSPLSPAHETEQHTMWGASVHLDEMPSKEQQLILVLRNILHTQNMLIPQLEKLLYVLDSTADMFRAEIEEFHRSKAYTHIETTYSRLTTMVLDAFIRKKTIQLLEFVEDAMKNSQLQHGRPSGLRTYALEMLLELSLIHSRFENIASGSVNNPKMELRNIIGDEFHVDFASDSDEDLNPLARDEDFGAPNKRLSTRNVSGITGPSSSVDGRNPNRNPRGGGGGSGGTSPKRLSSMNGDESLTTRIFESLCERLAELFMEFLVDSNYETIGENAALQLVIEITFIRKTLKKYESERAKKIYDRIFLLIEQLSNYDSSNVRNIKLIKESLKAVKSRTLFQLESLRM